MQKKIPVGVIGATGTVGKVFVSRLHDHPWFDLVSLAASSLSAGKPYGKALADKGTAAVDIPGSLADLPLLDAVKDVQKITSEADIIFSALSMPKPEVRRLEEEYAAAGAAVISNNSAHRWTEDVPIILPEVNPQHSALIDIQRKRRNWTKGLIAVKPNCSIQSYVPVLEAMKKFTPLRVIVATYQAVSGAGKSMESWPEMRDNVIPYIPGEEEKSEREPLKVWGILEDDGIKLSALPLISTTCVRVPVSEGHLAVVHVAFEKETSFEELRECLENYPNPIADLNLPSAPKKFIRYIDGDDRPQTAVDRETERGMSITVGRLRPDTILGWKFVALSHNTRRGAAGGGILMAELLVKQGFITI